MSCCGQRRQHLTGATSPARPEPKEPRPNRSRLLFTIAFEYTGQTSLTVVGAVSGRRYRFDGPGARVVVDPRDRPSLAKVPRLRQATSAGSEAGMSY
jgi:hypothetical protein